MTIECLPRSGWPDVLIRRGYRLEEIDGGERILPHAIHMPIAIAIDGSLEPLTPGSTLPTTLVTHHAGIHKGEALLVQYAVAGHLSGGLI